MSKLLTCLLTFQRVLYNDDVGRVIICQHLWPPWRYRTNWHTRFQPRTAHGWGMWQDVSLDELRTIAGGDREWQTR